MKSDKNCVFCISITKSLKSLQEFYDVILIMEENMNMVRNLKNFCFNSNLPKDLDENAKRKVELLIKSNESLAENKRNEIKVLLLKYKPVENIYEHRKQQNE